MNTDVHKFEYKEETQTIISCSMEVLNEPGHGLLEKPHENALCVEFRLRDTSYIRQARFNIFYKEVQVGECMPDLIVLDKTVADTKVVDHITDHEVGQMINYLKITGHKAGLIINFKKPRLEWRRVIL
jgi:GxxExxY protein